jgi:pyruvate/2-oxoglutarate dehydrogenase complex dihydrolipoamide acyltransferase (E2) component
MLHQIKLPVLGDTTRNAFISEWLVNVGESVQVDQPLVRVETDKAVVDVPSPVAGTLVEQLVALEDEIDIGTPIAVIDGPA